MARILKNVFTYEGGEKKTKTLNIYEPKENLEQEEVKTALEAIVASQAFAGVTGVVKSTLFTTENELIYEA